MRPSRIVLLLVAILAGGLAAFLATRGDRPVQVVQGPEVIIEEAKEVVHIHFGEFLDAFQCPRFQLSHSHLMR